MYRILIVRRREICDGLEEYISTKPVHRIWLAEKVFPRISQI